MLSNLEKQYQNCKQDRKKLHNLEWGNRDVSCSLLGEAEVRADAVIGIVDRYGRHLSGQFKSPGRFCTVNLKGFAVISGDDLHDFRHVRHDSANKSVFFRAHEDTSCNPCNRTFIDQAG